MILQKRIVGDWHQPSWHFHLKREIIEWVNQFSETYYIWENIKIFDISTHLCTEFMIMPLSLEIKFGDPAEEILFKLTWIQNDFE